MKRPIKPEKVQFIVVDGLCGFGGFTEGAEKAVDEDGDRIAVVIVGINHDAKAIDAHSRNHPETQHFIEDIRDESLPMRIMQYVTRARMVYPNALLLFHNSLECTNFSNAKGGMERDPDSRSLADVMPMYLKVLQPDIFTVENVREFMTWGPMMHKLGKTKEGFPFSFLVPVKEGKGKKKKIVGYKPHWVPIPEYKGMYFDAWKENVEGLGYAYGHRLHNTADIGAHTSRTRYFGVFAVDPAMRVWPEQTHAKNPRQMHIHGRMLRKWNAIRDCLDLEVKGKSIFRDPPLSEETYKRILEGCFRNIGTGDRSFMTKYFSGDGMNFSLSEPCHTITGIDHHALVQCEPFMMTYNSGSPEHRVKSMNDPSQTITTNNRLALVSVDKFCIKYFGTGINFGLDEVCSTLTTKDRVALIEAQFINLQYSNGKTEQSVDDPAAAITTVPKHNLVTAEFIDKQYGKSVPSGVDEPAACITVNPHLALLQAFTYDPAWGGHSRSIDDPAGTIVASQHKVPISLVNLQYVMKTHFEGGSRALDEPGFTTTASRHFDYLVTAERNVQPVILIYEDDCLTVKKLKVFMAHYGISDILMRMLMVKELLQIQGFPSDYKLLKSDTDNKKFIGNSIPPLYVRRWIEAFGVALRKLNRKAA